VTLAGFLALIAPCGGSSGLPKEVAAAAAVDIATPAAAVARTSRLENMAFSFLHRDHVVDVVGVEFAAVELSLQAQNLRAPAVHLQPNLFFGLTSIMRPMGGDIIKADSSPRSQFANVHIVAVVLRQNAFLAFNARAAQSLRNSADCLI
jgi:hypothetical protein